MTTPIRSSRSLTMLAAGIYGIGLVCSAVKAQTISVVGPIAGGGFSRAYAVNSSGTVVAGYSDNALGQDVAIRWTSAGGSVSMGLLPGGSTNSYAQAIDSTGNIIAGYGDSGGSTRAFRWTNTGGYQILPFASGTSGFNRATGISADGSIIAGVSGLGGAANGFNWYANNPTFPFNMCAGLGAGNTSIAVSADGSAMAGVCGNTVHRRTYIPNSVGSSNSVPGQMWSMGEAISGNGTAITGRYGTNTGGEMGFRWSVTTPPFMIVLPQTPNGSAALRPRAINGDGNTIIGQVVDNVAGFTCFVWTPSLGSQLLTQHLQQRGVNLAGWQLTDATGISPDGTAMCGHGIFGGNAVGWVVRGLACPVVSGTGFNLSHCPGDNFSIPTSSGGVCCGTFTYLWYRNGVPLANGPQPSGSTIVGATTYGMVIQGAMPGDAGTYWSVVSAAGACAVQGPSTTLTIYAGPTILNQPGDTSACTNGSPSLFAAANPVVGAAQYRWQKFVGPGPNGYADIFDGPTGNGSTYFNTGGTTFTILGLQPADGTRYRCRIQDSVCGAASQVFTNSALITVLPDTTVIVHPQPQTVCPSANFVFFTVVADPVGASFTYQWQRHQPPFPNVYNNINNGPSGFGGTVSGAQTSFLGISNPFGGDFDRYRCVVTGPCGFAATSANALLSAIPYSAVTSGPTGGAGCPFGAAALAITATPAGSTYQWQQYVGPCILCYFDVADGPTGNGGTFSGAQSPTLSINGLNLFDTFTQFRCIVTGPCTNTPLAASPDAFFTLMDSPFFQTQPTGGPVCKNGTKTMTVALAPGNYGTLSYQWWRYVPAFPIFAGVPNGALPSGAAASGAQSPSLTISNFKPQDAGQYYCKAMGDCGNVFSNVVNLTSCFADFNCDGVLTVNDIFDFLAAWFAGNPNADFNGIGGTNIQDIFDFLAAWFAGCGG